MRVTGLQDTLNSAFGGSPGAVAAVRCGSELANIYADWGLSVPAPNPVVANSAGVFPAVFVAIHADGPRDEEGAVVSIHKVNR